MNQARIGWLLIVSGALVIACGRSEDNQADMASVRACSTGAWTRAEHACTCPTGFILNSPECGAADCREANAVVLREDGTSFDFAYRYSQKSGTLSVVGGAGGVSEGKWSITSDLRLVQRFGAKSYETPVTCGGDSLVRTSAVYARLAPSRSTSVAQAVESRWSTVPLAR